MYYSNDIHVLFFRKMPAPAPPVEAADPPRTELQELQYKAGQVTDEVRIVLKNITLSVFVSEADDSSNIRLSTTSSQHENKYETYDEKELTICQAQLQVSESV